ncbi:MAG: hypothetical protein R6X22_05795 [Gemmatimonadota bacterium]|jgi:hypothetical protein
MTDEPITLDLFVEGRGVVRGARLAPLPGGLVCEGVVLAWSDLFFVSRRSGMLLLFGTGGGVVAKGRGEALDRLDGWIGRAVDQTELRRRLVRQLGHEVVLFTAGCAASGSIDGQAVRGLYVAAATRRGLYLVSGREQWTLSWPVERVRRQLARSGEPGGDALMLARGDSELSLRYLFPEEVIAIATAARQTPSPRPTGGPALEMFRRKEVEPPRQADLPEFSLAAGSLQAVAERAAANVPGELRTRALMPPDFFEEHFLELGEIALGPLLLRKSAAGRADSLRRAVAAMDAARLQEDTRAAVAAAAERTLGAWEQQRDRLVAMKRRTGRSRREPWTADSAGRELLVGNLQAPFERLWVRFEGLVDQQERLLALLEELEEGPPGQDDAEMREAADEWRGTLGRLDSGYEGAWRELVEEVEKTWSTELLPGLARIVTADAEELPEWVKLVVLGVITLFIAAALVALVVR